MKKAPSTSRLTTQPVADRSCTQPHDAGGVTHGTSGNVDPEQAVRDDEARIAALAQLGAIEYDRQRNVQAKCLGVRPGTLDKMVKQAREDAAIADVVSFADADPWHEPVNGAALLTEMTQAIRRFLICEHETAATAALWCALTWFLKSTRVCPILLINAPEQGCGKTLMLTLVGKMVPRPAQASSVTASVMFRLVEKYSPTLLVDEIETVMTKGSEDLRGVLNAGHTRSSAYVWRTVLVGNDYEPRRFSVFGFRALAGINADQLAETVTSRSVVAQLCRRMPNEKVERLRHTHDDIFDVICSKLARWAADNTDAFCEARPYLPEALSDRDQDNWEPMFAIADLVSGEWPELARRAAVKMSLARQQNVQSESAELLADIQQVFELQRVTRLSSVDLLRELCSDEEKAWATWNRGSAMTPRQLANMLRTYGVSSVNLKVGYGEVRKGYQAEHFEDAFTRYIPGYAESTAIH